MCKVFGVEKLLFSSLQFGSFENGKVHTSLNKEVFNQQQVFITCVAIKLRWPQFAFTYTGNDRYF